MIEPTENRRPVPTAKVLFGAGLLASLAHISMILLVAPNFTRLWDDVGVELPWLSRVLIGSHWVRWMIAGVNLLLLVDVLRRRKTHIFYGCVAVASMITIAILMQYALYAPIFSIIRKVGD